MSIMDLLKKTKLYAWYHQKHIKRIKELEAIRSKFFLEEGEDLLKRFTLAMNEAKIPFWLEFGSLLGFYRENDFIKHDCDIDFGAYLKDREAIRTTLEKAGFKLILFFESSDGGVEECYKYKHTSFDIFYFREDAETLYCNTFIGKYPYIINRFIHSKKYLVKRIDIPKQPFVKAIFKGSEVYVPENCVKHLEMHYGKTFMTPNPNFSGKRDATNITYYTYDECQGVLSEFGKK